MKKLLGLLAATGLVASSTISVVACGKKPGVSTEDSVLATKFLIDEFIKEVGSTIYTHLESESVHTNLTREIKTGVAVNDFFSKENILKYGTDENNLEGTVTPLGDGDKTKINEAFHNLVETKSLETKINKLATETDKYSILVNGGVIVKDIVFDINSFTMNYVNAAKFVGKASVKMTVNFTYIDYNQTIVSGAVANTIVLRVTDESTIIEGITKLENNLANDLLNSDSTTVWNTATSSGYNQTELYKSFELYNEQKRKNKLNSQISNEDWQKTINDFISNQKYFGVNQSNDVEMDFSAKEIKSDKLVSKIEPITHVSAPDFYEDNLSLRQTIFQKYQANEDLNFASGTSKVNQNIYDILNGTFKDSYNNFKTSMRKNILGYTGSNLGNDNILLGESVLAGLSLNFKDLNFALPLNTFKLTYSFSLTGSKLDLEANSTLDKSDLGEAVYKNVEAGIKSFQENFGIVDGNDTEYLNQVYSRFNDDGSPVENQKSITTRIPMVFTGNRLTGQPLNVNIFDELGTEISTDKSAEISKLSSVLSLETEKLSAVRYNLLGDGYQGNFTFKTATTISILENGTITKRVEQAGPYSGFTFKNSSGKDFYLSSYGTGMAFKNQYGSNLSFRFDLSLFSVHLSLPELFSLYNHGSADKQYQKYVVTLHKTYSLFSKA